MPMALSNAVDGGQPCVVAFYLPQFHPIPENDLWWEPGFTEWTNVARARRAVSRATINLASRVSSGSTTSAFPRREKHKRFLPRCTASPAFCYWHYWFGGGRRLLERPFDEVLKSGKPDFPFCLGWANQTWSGIWHGAPNRVLIQQTYRRRAGLPRALRIRSSRVDGSALSSASTGVHSFCVYDPTDLPRCQRFLDLWRTWAVDEGLPGMFFVGRTETMGGRVRQILTRSSLERVPTREIARSGLAQTRR